MKVTRLFLAIMTVCTIGILVIGCGNKKELPQEETIKQNLNVAIYAATDADGEITPVEPALFQECVSVDRNRAQALRIQTLRHSLFHQGRAVQSIRPHQTAMSKNKALQVVEG